MTEYNQNAASDEFGNYMNRLAGAAGIGQTATNMTGMYAGQYAQNAGNNAMNSGMARASGYLGMGNAITSGMNNFGAAMAYRGAPPPGQRNNFDPNGFTGTYYGQTGRG
jgi:hypothetical protein